MNRTILFLVSAFPLWVLITCSIAFVKPQLFKWFTGDWITYGLGLIMLGMGITLKPEDFSLVF